MALTVENSRTVDVAAMWFEQDRYKSRMGAIRKIGHSGGERAAREDGKNPDAIM